MESCDAEAESVKENETVNVPEIHYHSPKGKTPVAGRSQCYLGLRLIL
jgi:hypothetical protein